MCAYRSKLIEYYSMTREEPVQSPDEILKDKDSLHLQPPAFEKVFEDEDVFNKIKAYIAERKALQGQVNQLQSQL